MIVVVSDEFGAFFGLSDVLSSISLSLISWTQKPENPENFSLFFVFFILVLADYTTSL